MPSKEVWIIGAAVTGVLLIFVAVVVWGFSVIIKECIKICKKNKNYSKVPNDNVNGKVVDENGQYIAENDRNIFDEEEDLIYEKPKREDNELSEDFYKSTDSLVDPSAYPYGKATPVQPMNSNQLNSSLDVPRSCYISTLPISPNPNSRKDRSKRIIKKRGFKDQLLSKATMVLEMYRCEKSDTVIGLVKNLNIPRIQGVEYPTEVCFRITKLPILHKKQLIYKTWWKKYTSSLLMLSFTLSEMKCTDSMRIRMYGKHKKGLLSQEKCHGESVIHMKDLTSEMALYTYSFLPKGTTLIMDDKNILSECGYISQSPCGSHGMIEE